MYLLIQKSPQRCSLRIQYLHSTMYLLILARIIAICNQKGFTFHYVSINSFCSWYYVHFSIIFTFHYVSINSNSGTFCGCGFVHLHSTMYLLIPVIIKASLFLNSEALFCLPFKSANRLLILYALNMPEA